MMCGEVLVGGREGKIAATPEYKMEVTEIVYKKIIH